uniref:Uncharacterized protein n=1 Tax=Callorhinchus milii TaxID=7868 RepID=A0A4W3ID63_CALMI
MHVFILFPDWLCPFFIAFVASMILAIVICSLLHLRKSKKREYEVMEWVNAMDNGVNLYHPLLHWINNNNDFSIKSKFNYPAFFFTSSTRLSSCLKNTKIRKLSFHSSQSRDEIASIYGKSNIISSKPQNKAKRCQLHSKASPPHCTEITFCFSLSPTPYWARHSVHPCPLPHYTEMTLFVPLPFLPILGKGTSASYCVAYSDLILQVSHKLGLSFLA